MGEVQYIWAEQSSGAHQVAFSSLVQAMLTSGVIAIARWVSRDGMDPRMGVLVPREFERVDCFLWMQVNSFVLGQFVCIGTVNAETILRL